MDYKLNLLSNKYSKILFKHDLYISISDQYELMFGKSYINSTENIIAESGMSD